MRVEELLWTQGSGWRGEVGAGADLVLYFGERAALMDGAAFGDLRTLYPGAHLLGCSTGGQIRGESVSDEQVAAVALRFAATRLRLARQPLTDATQSRLCGEVLGRDLAADDLAGVFVLCDGLNVNGSELVAGISSATGGVPLTGGLAGDGARFEKTLVGANDVPRSGVAAALGFYGSKIRFGHGSAGGWDVFGPRRRITRSEGSLLLELDGEPALDLYERYLGPEEIEGLPGTALLFPLQVFDPARPDHMVVRTVLAVDRHARSMTFAGDVPEGWMAQLMRGNFDRLAAGAGDAARQACARVQDAPADQLALLVSCIGRRLLMGQRVADEVEATHAEFRPGTRQIGFYSYGEISPHQASGICELHNQTMTVTTLAEAA